MNKGNLSWLFHEYTAKVLYHTSHRPCGASDMVDLSGVPRGTAYPIIHRLERLGLLFPANPGRTIKGKPFRRWASNVAAMYVVVEHGQVKVIVQRKDGTLLREVLV